jgi:hypothetical protein
VIFVVAVPAFFFFLLFSITFFITITLVSFFAVKVRVAQKEVFTTKPTYSILKVVLVFGFFLLIFVYLFSVRVLKELPRFTAEWTADYFNGAVNADTVVAIVPLYKITAITRPSLSFVAYTAFTCIFTIVAFTIGFFIISTLFAVVILFAHLYFNREVFKSNS